MLPSRCAGIGPVGRHDVAVVLPQLHAHVGMQLQIERPHLLPQTVDLGGERVGRHVVFRAPHAAGVGKAQFSRALVRQLDEALVVAPHRHRDGVPALPDAAQFGLAARVRHDAGDVVDVETPLRFRRLRTELAFAVGRPHPRRDSGQLFGFSRVGRRGHHQRELQQLQLPALVGWHLDMVEARALLREPRDRVDHFLIDPRVDGLGVVGDVGLRHPPRLVLRDPEPGHRVVHGREERRDVRG